MPHFHSSNTLLCDTTRTTYHIARIQEPNLKEEGYIGTITVKFFFSLSLSFVREIEQGSPSILLEYNNNCNNTLHAPIRSHADNVARI